MSQLSLADELRRHTLDSQVQEEREALNPNKFTVWSPGGGDKMLRITVPQGAVPTKDGDVNWAQAFEREHEKVKQNLLQWAIGSGLEGSLQGPDKKPYRPVGKPTDVTVAWSSEPGKDIEPLLQSRLAAGRATIRRLGASIACVEGMPPVKRTLIQEPYGPETTQLLQDHEVRERFQRGMDHIFGQVYDAPRPGEHPSAPLLRNLKEFRKNRARWAAIDYDRGLNPVESMGDAWMAVVPPTSEIVQEQRHTILVRAEPGVGGKKIWVMRVLPVGFTPEWAGLAGVHEMEHLENYVTGKEPAGAPRDQYLEGEIRAFTGEIGAADILSRGRFIQAVDAMIDVYGFRGVDDIKPLMTTAKPALLMLARNLDPYITTEKPQSENEVGIRLALYWMAVAFRLAERNVGGDAVAEKEAKKQIVEFTYGPEGANVVPGH